MQGVQTCVRVSEMNTQSQTVQMSDVVEYGEYTMEARDHREPGECRWYQARAGSSSQCMQGVQTCVRVSEMVKA